MRGKPRAEIEGGLYHVITRGNNRRPIFDSPADYEQFLLLLAKQKQKPPFLLDRAKLKVRQDEETSKLLVRIMKAYGRRVRIAKSQA